MNISSKVAVIGAGISGLSAAYWLKKDGYDVTIFEKADHIGGSIFTYKENGFLLDLGPNSTLETSDVLRSLIKELGLEDQKIYGNQASNNRYILKKGKLIPLPTSLFAFIKTPLFSTKAKLRLLREPFIKATHETDISLADFVRYRLGNEFLDYAINPFVAGVYAGNPEHLSTSAAFPKLYALEQKYGSLIKGAIKGVKERRKRKEVAKDRAKLFSFRHGMEVFPRALANHLTKEIKLESSIKSIRNTGQGFELRVDYKGIISETTFDKVVFAIPTFALEKLIEPLDSTASEILREVKYPPVGVVTMAFKNEKVGRPLDGFGFLVPEKENRKILGSIWSSTIFLNRAPTGYDLFTTFVGGTRQPELVQLNDDQLTSIVLAELSSILQIKGDPDLIRIKRWERAIPQYNIGYQRVRDAYDRLEKDFPGLYIVGNTRKGISVGDSVLCAFEVTRKILNGG